MIDRAAVLVSVTLFCDARVLAHIHMQVGIQCRCMRLEAICGIPSLIHTHTHTNTHTHTHTHTCIHAGTGYSHQAAAIRPSLSTPISDEDQRGTYNMSVAIPSRTNARHALRAPPNIPRRMTQQHRRKLVCRCGIPLKIEHAISRIPRHVAPGLVELGVQPSLGAVGPAGEGHSLGLAALIHQVDEHCTRHAAAPSAVKA